MEDERVDDSETPHTDDDRVEQVIVPDDREIAARRDCGSERGIVVCERNGFTLDPDLTTSGRDQVEGLHEIAKWW